VASITAGFVVQASGADSPQLVLRKDTHLVYYLLILVLVMVVFSKVQSNRRRKHADTLADSIRPGARVMTTAGIYGIIVEIETDTIVIEISEGVDVRFAKAAVVKVVPDLVDDLDEADGEDADDGQGDHLTDAELHAELDALDPPRAEGDGAPKPGAGPIDRLSKRRNSPTANEAQDDGKSARETPRDLGRDLGHEPGTGPVPTS